MSKFGRIMVIIFLFPAIFSWSTLAVTGMSFGPWYAMLLIVAILVLNVYVWRFLWGQKYPSLSAAAIVLLVIELAVGAQGVFAEMYRAMSEHSPHSFDPSPLSGIDVAYFTIGTATTGSGDIHPVTGAARLLVSAQQITTVYLVVIAITTAVGRVRSGSEDAPDEPTNSAPTGT